MPPNGRATTSRQQPQAIVEARCQSADAKEIRARSRQLDRQRQAIECAADAGHDRTLGIVQLERMQAGRGALSKQLDRREAERLSCGEHSTRWRQDPLALGAQGLAAGGNHMDTRYAREELFGKVRGGINDVLAVVQHDQHLLGLQKFDDAW
jgi:hypothetical protein